MTSTIPGPLPSREDGGRPLRAMGGALVARPETGPVQITPGGTVAIPDPSWPGGAMELTPTQALAVLDALDAHRAELEAAAERLRWAKLLERAVAYLRTDLPAPDNVTAEMWDRQAPLMVRMRSAADVAAVARHFSTEMREFTRTGTGTGPMVETTVDGIEYRAAAVTP